MTKTETRKEFSTHLSHLLATIAQEAGYEFEELSIVWEEKGAILAQYVIRADSKKKSMMHTIDEGRLAFIAEDLLKYLSDDIAMLDREKEISGR